MYETSRCLDSVVPLKEGEKHCLHCAGFGGLPVDRNASITISACAVKCTYCGKETKN